MWDIIIASEFYNIDNVALYNTYNVLYIKEKSKLEGYYSKSVNSFFYYFLTKC